MSARLQGAKFRQRQREEIRLRTHTARLVVQIFLLLYRHRSGQKKVTGRLARQKSADRSAPVRLIYRFFFFFLLLLLDG